MANMSYCRFQNTAADLADCLEAIRRPGEVYGDDKISAKELEAAKQLAWLCAQVLTELADAGHMDEEDLFSEHALEAAVDGVLGEEPRL